VPIFFQSLEETLFITICIEKHCTRPLRFPKEIKLWWT